MPDTAERIIRLRPNDGVALLVDELPAVPAMVVATTREEATLVLRGGSLPARMLHRRRAAVERAYEGRRFRGEGTLSMAVGRRGRVLDDTVVLHFGPPQRRSESRIPAVLPVTLVPMGASLAPARALTLDVSPRGVLVRSSAALERGADVQLHLQIPAEELPIPAAGAVVRRTGDGLLGVRLDTMRPADRELVEAWLRGQSPQG